MSRRVQVAEISLGAVILAVSFLIQSYGKIDYISYGALIAIAIIVAIALIGDGLDQIWNDISFKWFVSKVDWITAQ